MAEDLNLHGTEKNKASADSQNIEPGIEQKKKKPIPMGNAKRWLDRIERSKKAAKPFKDDAERFLRMYQGDYSARPGKKRQTDAMSVNTVYSYVETVTPAIFSGFPYIRVRPKKKYGQDPQSAVAAARNMEANLNYWAKELSADVELRDVLFDSFFSHAATEVGWETETDHVEEDTVDDEDTSLDDGQRLAQSFVIKKDRPFIMRREPYDILFDPDARRRKECRWYGIREVIQYNDFLASDKYTEKAKARLKPQYYPVDTPTDTTNWLGREDERSEKEWLEIYTIFDKEHRKKIVVAKGYDQFLNTEDPAGEEWEYWIDYKDDPYPICILDAKRDKRSPYSWSEFKAFEAQIIELNRIRSAIQIHVRRTLPRYLAKKTVSAKEISKFTNSRSDEVTQMEDPDGIKAFDSADIPADYWKFNDMARDDLINVSSMMEYQNESFAKTATEAQIQQGQGEVRKSMRSTLWEQYVVEVFAKLGQLCQQFQDEKVAIQIAGPQGLDWLHVSKEDIQGEFIFEIEPGIMKYKNEIMRKQQNLKFMELAQNNPFVNQKVVISKVAQDYDMDPDEIIQDPPPPPPPEPNTSFKDIDPLHITDEAVKLQIIKTAMEQNGIPVPPELTDKIQSLSIAPSPPPVAQPPAPMGGGAPELPGKDLGGGNPNGNPNLPPVSGNQQDNPLSMMSK